MSIESVMLSISSSVTHFFFCLWSFPASGSFLYSALCSKWQVLELPLQHQSFQWIFRVVSFRTDWFDLLAVQETVNSLLQYHNSKASIFWYSAFLMVQISYLYMNVGKTIPLTLWTFVSKWCLLFKMLSRFVIVFLPKSKHLLISRLQSLSAMILELKKIESVTASTFPLLFAWSDGTGCHDSIFLRVEF